MYRLLITISLLLWLVASSAQAQQSEQFDRFNVHYNALSTSLLSPDIAQAYGLTRSPNRGMVNITVLDGDTATRATVQVSARNLTGQAKNVEMQEILEPDDAVYYIGQFNVSNMETLVFTVRVRPQGSDAPPFQFQFQQQFYTE